MLTVIIYDVSCDRRRGRLHKLLEEYGTPVQKSAFEARVTAAERKRMLERAGPLIDPKEDRFVVYTVPAHLEDGIRQLGVPRPVVESPTFFVV